MVCDKFDKEFVRAYQNLGLSNNFMRLERLAKTIPWA